MLGEEDRQSERAGVERGRSIVREGWCWERKTDSQRGLVLREEDRQSERTGVERGRPLVREGWC